MAQETTEARRPHPGPGPRNEQAAGHVVNGSVRRTSSSAHAELAALVERAQQLVEQIGEQAEADRREFDLGYRLGFETGVDVGQDRALQLQEQETRAQAEAVNAFSRTRTLQTHEQIGQVRYPGYTPEQLRVLRAPGRIFMPMDRLCLHCGGHGVIFGGAA